jgi:peptidoglycan/LPS O-acetylase OafA/YrhL
LRIKAATTAGQLTRSDHITSLDGVRGLAISLVLMEHLLWSNPNTGHKILDFASKIRSAGWVGVDLFFALSGFLITGILFDTLQLENCFKNFYSRRVLRIFPLYYAVLLILLVALHPRNFDQARPFVRLFFYLQNTPLWWSASMPATTIALTDHLWSLAVEEQFYLVWPVLIFFLRDRSRLMWAALLLAALAPITRWILLSHGAPFGETYTFTCCRADSLLCGAWLALIMRGDSRSKVLRFAMPVFAVSLFGCITMAWRGAGFDFLTSRAINLYGYTLIAIASTAFIAMSLKPQSLMAKAMNIGVLRSLGKYSYGIYILHHLVSFGAEITILSLLRTHVESRVLYHLLSMMIVLSVTVLLAWASYNFYERRFLQLKRYFKYPAPQA